MIFRIAGKPVPKSNKNTIGYRHDRKFCRECKRGTPIILKTKDWKAYEEYATQLVQLQKNRQEPLREKDGFIRVDIIIRYAVTSGHVGDGDNVEKGILDILEGAGVFTDDNNVVESHRYKLYQQPQDEVLVVVGNSGMTMLDLSGLLALFEEGVTKGSVDVTAKGRTGTSKDELCCVVQPWCGNLVYSQRFCKKHWQQYYR